MDNQEKVDQLRAQMTQAALRVGKQAQAIALLATSGQPAAAEEAVLAHLVQELETTRSALLVHEEAVKAAKSIDIAL